MLNARVEAPHCNVVLCFLKHPHRRVSALGLECKHISYQSPSLGSSREVWVAMSPSSRWQQLL